MKIVLLTNEYPPHIYGGAGVHVNHLADQLTRLENGRHTLQVLCFGDQHHENGNRRVRGVPAPAPFPCEDSHHRKLLDALYRDIAMAGSVPEADLVHCHTWYTHLAGCLLKQVLEVPLVLTTHSLEPHRPWKAEQLGSGYRASVWLERTAYRNADGIIAVSAAMKRDVTQLYSVASDRVKVIHNGIDADRYRPTSNREVLASCGIDPETPYILFVGRITRQKGIGHLLRAVPMLRPGVQLVLCAAAPDTEALGEEVKGLLQRVADAGDHPVVWIPDMVPVDQLIVLYSHALVFVCPSIYEPFGIINLEAMACGTPVVGSVVGGIPEIVVHGETGLLVPLGEQRPETLEPEDPEQFARMLAAAVNELLDDPAAAGNMGHAARRRVEKHFSWEAIGRKTLDYYRELIGG